MTRNTFYHISHSKNSITFIQNFIAISLLFFLLNSQSSKMNARKAQGRSIIHTKNASCIWYKPSCTGADISAPFSPAKKAQNCWEFATDAKQVSKLARSMSISCQIGRLVNSMLSNSQMLHSNMSTSQNAEFPGLPDTFKKGAQKWSFLTLFKRDCVQSMEIQQVFSKQATRGQGPMATKICHLWPLAKSIQDLLRNSQIFLEIDKMARNTRYDLSHSENWITFI